MNLIPNKRVIIDCDPGIDDALALMLAVASEDIEVEAVTVVCGNVPTALGTANARLVLKLMGREDIPVIAGADAPLSRPLVTAQDTHGMDGLGETRWGRMAAEDMAKSAQDTPQLCMTDVSDTQDFGAVDLDGRMNAAAAYISERLMCEPGLSVIALGPMTNIAAAMQLNREAFKNTGYFISMGGSYKSHGNCSPVAEFNYWVDPEAARYVYEHTPVKIHMVGLDVTRKIVLRPDVCSLISRFENERAKFILDITRFYTDFHWKQERILGCVINDPLAVAYFIALCGGKTDLCTGFESYVTVETQGLCAGQSVVDAYSFWGKSANALVLTRTDAPRFMTMFLNTLFPEYVCDIKAGLLHVYGGERTFGEAGVSAQQGAGYFEKGKVADYE